MFKYSILTFLFFSFSVSTLFSQNDVTANKKGLYGIYDSKKKWVLVPTYTELGYLPIYENSHSIYLLGKDNKGSVLIETKEFKKISPVYTSIELIDAKGKLFIVRDKTIEYLYQIGKGIIAPTSGFDSYKKLPDDETLLVLTKGKQSCFFNKKDYTQTPFIDGTIISNFSLQQYLVKQNNKYGVVGLEGNFIIQKEYDTLIPIFNYEPCSNLIAVKKEGKWGIITGSSATMIPTEYENIDARIMKRLSFSLDSCFNVYPVKTNGKWGFVNEQNKTILSPQYDSIVDYINPLKFTVIKNNKRGIIDLKGNTLFPFNYKYFEAINNFSGEYLNKKNYFINNSCIICDPLEQEGGWGISDSTGKIIQEMNATVIPLRVYGKEEYENFDSSNYGFLWNIGGEKIKTLIDIDTIQNEQYGVDGNSIFVLVPDYKYSYNILGGKTGILNNEGKIIVPIVNEDMGISLLHFCGYETCGTHDLNSLSIQNKACKSSYTLRSPEYFKIKQNNKWGLLNFSGKQIIPCMYDSIQKYGIDRYSICDVSDSLQNTLNFPLNQFVAYSNGHKYFLKNDGTFLAKQLQKEKTVGSLNFISNAPNKMEYYFSPIYNLIAINPIDSFYTISYGKEEFETFDETGEYISNRMVKIENTLYSPTAAAFNFYNPITQKYLFTEPVEDFIIRADRMDRGFQAYQWSILKDKLKIISSNYVDNFVTTVAVDQTNHSLPNINDLSNFGVFDSILFVKQNNKWHIRNINEPNFKNKIGFDSVKINSPNTFLAYTVDGFASYRFNDTLFNKTKITMEFPDYNGFKIVCASCEYTLIDKTTRKIHQSLDEYGNELPQDTTLCTTKIPYIIKGRLNVTSATSETLIENWADEIIFPGSISTFYDVNLSNKNDSIFNYSILDYNNLSAITHARTIAYRIDNLWYLKSLLENKLLIGPFDSVSRIDQMWEASKSGIIKKYSVENLVEEK